MNRLKTKLLAVWGFLKCWFGCHEWEDAGVLETGGADYAERYHCHTCTRCSMEVVCREKQ